MLVFALTFAIVNWLAVEYRWKSLEYFAKPAAMIFLTIWLVQVGGLSGWIVWFVMGALFSLGGDIFLMLPNNFFLAGLISFLFAHLAYIVGLNKSLPPFTMMGGIVFIVIVIIAYLTYRRLASNMNKKGLSSLKLPVFIYILIISLMTLSAVHTLLRVEWNLRSALLVSGGGILFFVSDFVLAWDRFVSPISHARLKTMITYHLSQAGILIGAATHFKF